MSEEGTIEAKKGIRVVVYDLESDEQVFAHELGEHSTFMVLTGPHYYVAHEERNEDESVIQVTIAHGDPPDAALGSLDLPML